MATLKTNYKDDMFSGDRKYREIRNSDGTVSFEDVTVYSQEGDVFASADINATNAEVNTLNQNLTELDDLVSGEPWKPTLLWTNPNLVDSFPAQTLNIDLSPYTAFEIYSYSATGQYIKQYTVQTMGRIIDIAYDNPGQLVGWYRIFTLPQDLKSITFDRCVKTYGSTYVDDNTHCRPYMIYGIK